MIHQNKMFMLRDFSGAFQLLQLQEDIRRQFKMDGSGPENDVESHIRLNKDTLMNSLWKLNVVDIEITLIHVSQLVSGFYSVPSFPLLKECMDAADDSDHGSYMHFQVLRENNVKKEELKARALALKILGKIFQVRCTQ